MEDIVFEDEAEELVNNLFSSSNTELIIFFSFEVSY